MNCCNSNIYKKIVAFMKRIVLCLFLAGSMQVWAQTPVFTIKKDTLKPRVQSDGNRPVMGQIRVSGEEIWARSAGNLMVVPGQLELFTTNDVPQRLTVKHRPSYQGTREVVWISEQPAVASVTSAGMVTALKKGSTRIMAISGGGSDTAWCHVSVGIANEWGNMRNPGYGFVATQGRWIYFAHPGEEGKLYKMDFRGQQLTQLCDDEPGNLQVVGRWIYYDCDEGIVRVDLEGKNRKLIDSRASLLRVNRDGTLYCTRENKVFTLDLKKPNQAMEVVFEDTDPVFNFTPDHYYLFYNKYWDNVEGDPLRGGIFRYNWTAKTKEQVVPLHHIIHSFALVENSNIVFYYQGGSNTTQVKSVLGIVVDTDGDPVQTGMFSTPNTHHQAKRIPQIDHLGIPWTLVGDWLYYFRDQELRRVKEAGEGDQSVAALESENYEIYSFGDFLILYSTENKSIFRMLPDGRDMVRIL